MRRVDLARARGFTLLEAMVDDAPPTSGSEPAAEAHDLRRANAACALIAYLGLVHVYAYAYHAGWLGPAGVLSNHFLILSCWSFICMFAVVPFFEPFRWINENVSAGARPSPASI